MPRLTRALRKHRASGQAVVTIAGRDHYLGSHGTKASKALYDGLIAEFLAGGRSGPAADDAEVVTVTTVLNDYWKFGAWGCKWACHLTSYPKRVNHRLRNRPMRVSPVVGGKFGFANPALSLSPLPAAWTSPLAGGGFGVNNPQLAAAFPDRSAHRYQAIAADRLRSAGQLHIVQRYEAVASEYLAMKGLTFGCRE